MSSRSALNQYQDLLMDAQRILINPLNKSSSKQQYSFPKASRFDRCKTQSGEYQFYNIPSTRSRLATTIGKADRETITSSKGKLPSPIDYTYAKDGEFSYSMMFKARKNRGFGFGLGRQQVKANNFLAVNKNTPDPWTYDPQTKKKKVNKQYSFSKAQKGSIGKIQLPSLSPGPGSYKISSSLQQNKQILSIQPRNGSPKFSQSKVQKKKGPERYPPLYNPKLSIKGNLLQFGKSKKGVVIGKGQREGISVSTKNPGPGCYKVFSEFIGKGKY